MNSSARSECSTSLSFSSPTPTRRSMQRRVTMSQPPSMRSESCSPFRHHQIHPTIHAKLSSDETGRVNGHTRGSPATSISSGLGRSFSPASAHSYQRPLGSILRQYLISISFSSILIVLIFIKKKQETKVRHRQRRAPTHFIRRRLGPVPAQLVVHQCPVWPLKRQLSATIGRLNGPFPPELRTVERWADPGHRQSMWNPFNPV